MARAGVIAVLSTGTLAPFPSVAGSQQVLRVPDVKGQPQWRLEFKRVMRLDLPSDAKPFDFPTSVQRDASGTFYVLDTFGPNPIWVFDASGKALRTIPARQALIARSFVRALAVSPPDTLHVLSGGEAVFSRTGTLVRKRVFPPDATIFRALSLPGGKLVLQAIIRTPDRFGYPLHLMGRGTSPERSFGAGPRAAFDGNPSKVVGALAVAGPDLFWASDQRQYRISLWRTTGVLQKVVERGPDWFRPWNAWNGRMDIAPPPPRLLSIWQDSQGLLFTLSAIASADWTPVPGRKSTGEAPPPSAAEFDDANDSVVEVIDSQRGVLLASERLPATLLAFVADSMVAGVSRDRTNRVGVDIWNVRIVPTRR